MSFGEFTTIKSKHVTLLASELEKRVAPVIDQFIPVADFEELFTFAEANPTPIGYSDQPAWCLESVAARAIESIGISVHEDLDRTGYETLASILLEHIEYLYTYPAAPTAREKLVAGSVLALSGCICAVLPQSELWRLAGFGRIAANLTEVPLSPSETYLLQPIDAAFKLADTYKLPILHTAAESYRTALNPSFKCQNSLEFPINEMDVFHFLNIDYKGLEDVKAAILKNDIISAELAYTEFRKEYCKGHKHTHHLEKSDTFRFVKLYLECLLKLSIYPTPAISSTTEVGIAALLFPEFRISDQLLTLAFRRFKWMCNAFFYTDGFHKDISIRAQAQAISEFTRFLDIYESTEHSQNIECIKEMKDVLNKQIIACKSILQPDLSFPPFVIEPISDNNDIVETYILGKVDHEDRALNPISSALPITGLYVMRNGLGTDAQYLCFDCGPLGKYGFQDRLSFVLYAHGHELITHSLQNDKGDTTLETSDSFNTILIDGSGLTNTQTNASENISDSDTQWITTDAFDYVEGWNKTSDYHHKRSIFYVKGKYYILHDVILGEGEHQIEQVFHLNSSQVVQKAGQAWTQDQGKSNVFICAASTDDLMLQLDGNKLTFQGSCELPIAINVLIHPMKPNVKKLPSVSAVSVGAEVDVLATGFTVEYNGNIDLILISDDGFAKMSTSEIGERIVFEGEYLFLRGDRFAMLNGKYLSVGTKILADLDIPCQSYTNIQ